MKFQRARMYARGVPVATAMRTLAVLVNRLSLRAESAVGDRISPRKSLPMARQTRANRGSPSRPISTRLGRMKTQPGLLSSENRRRRRCKGASA